MESTLRVPVRPVKPAAPWIGGKRNLAKRLVPLIEADDHQTYAEVFVGMAGVFLRRQTRPKAEVINDWSADVTTLFRILQRHYQPFMDMLKWQFSSRPEFERLLSLDPVKMTDLERAARFLVLQRLAFGGKVTGRSFGVSHHRAGRFDVTRLQVILEDLHERLAGVVIERLHWADFLARYDTPETLFYLDPPYWGSEDDYGAELFSQDEFERLAEALKGLRGRFILSLNDAPEVREIFSTFRLQPVELTYGIAASGATKARELIITPC